MRRQHCYTPFLKLCSKEEKGDVRTESWSSSRPTALRMKRRANKDW